MTKTKLGVFFDTLFIVIIIAIILLFWINKYIKNAFLSLFICIFISFWLFIAIFKQNLKFNNLAKIKTHELKSINKFLEKLKFSHHKFYNSYFEKLLKVKNISGYIFENNEKIFYINIKTILSSHDFFTANEYQFQTNKELHFINNSTDENFKKLLENSPTIFHNHNINELIELIKIKNFYPQPLTSSKSIKEKLKTTKSKFSNSLTRIRFKDYFFSGISLMIISAIAPYSFYYMIMGTILLIFSTICLFKKSKITVNQSATKSLVEIIKKQH